MKLLNYTSASFAAILLIVISLWAGIFYYALLDEIYDSIDDGLDNQKGLIIQKVQSDTSLLQRHDFEESDYAIREVPYAEAVSQYDIYIDTMMYMQNEKSEEPVRLLRTVFMQNDRYYQLDVITSMVEEDDLITQLLMYIIWLYMGMILSILLFNSLLLKRIWKPFYQILKSFKKFRVDDPSPLPPSNTRVTEFKLLYKTSEKLLQRNIDIFNSQKNFIENASHELQTPLAIAINKLETLAEGKELNSYQLELLSSAMNNLERLTRLNKSLLLLTRIENNQFEVIIPISVNQLASSIVDDFKDQAEFSDINLQLENREDCKVMMNADLASILLVNLIKNGIVHNIRSGYVNVIIGKTYIEVRNSGKNNPLNKNIFSRFKTGKSSPDSTGLGLSIVATIAAHYDFKISYLFSEEHIFRVELP